MLQEKHLIHRDLKPQVFSLLAKMRNSYGLAAYWKKNNLVGLHHFNVMNYIQNLGLVHVQ